MKSKSRDYHNTAFGNRHQSTFWPTPNQCVYLARKASELLRPYQVDETVDRALIDDVISAIDRRQVPTFISREKLDAAAVSITLRDMDIRHHIFSPASSARLLGVHNARVADDCDFRDTEKLLKIVSDFFDQKKEFTPSASYIQESTEQNIAELTAKLRMRRTALLKEIVSFSLVTAYICKKISRPANPCASQKNRAAPTP